MLLQVIWTNLLQRPLRESEVEIIPSVLSKYEEFRSRLPDIVSLNRNIDEYGFSWLMLALSPKIFPAIPRTQSNYAPIFRRHSQLMRELEEIENLISKLPERAKGLSLVVSQRQFLPSPIHP